MNLCIAHAGDLTDPSGGTDRVSALAAGLAERGHRVTVVAPLYEGDYPDRLDAVTLRPVDVGTDSAVASALAVTREAARVAKLENALVQFEHSPLAGIGTLHGHSGYVLDMHDLAHSRYDVVDHVAAPLLERGTAWLERRAVRRARRVVVVSETMREVLCERWGADPEAVTVVPNGYYPERLDPYATVDTVPGRVAFLGTLHPKVDLAVFRGLADLPAVSEVVVVGDGGQGERMAEIAASHDAVRYTGRLPDEEAFPLLAGASVAVNPQTASNLQRSSSPVKLYTYAALGLPMVVSPGPSVVDELVAADAAVTASGTGSFGRAVADLLADDDRRQRLAENARDAAREFRWDRRIDAVDGLYRRLSVTGGEPA